MKRLLFSCLAAGVFVVPAAAQSVPELPFESVKFFQMPADVHFGEIGGVAVNSKGHVFVFSRGNSSGPSYMATAAQLLEFDQTGKFVREIGKNLYAWTKASGCTTALGCTQSPGPRTAAEPLVRARHSWVSLAKYK